MHPRPVKKLDWRHRDRWSGRIACYPVSDATYRVGTLYAATSSFYVTFEEGDDYVEEIGVASDLRAAKLLCQKHFEKRILSCLTPEARRKLNP